MIAARYLGQLPAAHRDGDELHQRHDGREDGRQSDHAEREEPLVETADALALTPHDGGAGIETCRRPDKKIGSGPADRSESSRPGGFRQTRHSQSDRAPLPERKIAAQRTSSPTPALLWELSRV